MDRRPHLLAGVALLGAGAAIPAAAAGMLLTSPLWTNVGWTVGALAATAALVRAALITPDSDRFAWRLLAAASACWFCGQLCWDLWSLGLPLHELGDLFWLVFAPLSAIGLARLVASETDKRGLIWEAVPVAAAIAALITAMLYGDIVASSLGPVERWTSLAYPITYSIVPILTAQVLLAHRVRIHLRPDLILIAAGVAAQAVGFTAWAPRLLDQTYSVGHPLDLWWTAGLVLIAAGGLLHHAQTKPLTSGGRRRMGTILPGSLFTVLLALLLVGTLGKWSLGQRMVLEVGALAVGGLIGARMTALTRRQRELLDSERNTRSELQRTADELSHVALHDALTALPNRTLFMDRATQAIASARRNATWTAVLFLDVDDFKRVNDVFGHSAGDGLLREIAARLGRVVRPSDTVSRFGGDEFTILCPGLDSDEAAVQIARRIIGAFERPFRVGARELHSATSVGIAVARSGEGDAETLVRDADAAMYRAKERGRGGYEVFDESVRERLVARLRMENALRTALDRDELRVAYQPFFNLSDDRILGFEALLRWDSPELGVVPPSEFIAVAEQSGLIQKIGAWVLRQALATIAELRREHPELDLHVAVNLSARQIHDGTLPDLVATELARHDLPPSALALEITESDLIEDALSVRESIAGLRSTGVQLMLDDFGTGFSSLSYLKRFPVHTLKIDRSFVAGLGSGEGDRAIVAAIMGVATALDLRVIAEGVETELQADELRQLGCTVAQGYLFAKAVFEPDSLLGAEPVPA